MKPVKLSQLISEGHAPTLSLFWSAKTSNEQNLNPEQFFREVSQNLESDENGKNLIQLINRDLQKMLKVIELHPYQSFAFYLSEQFSGHVGLDHLSESYFIEDMKFYVRPILEELSVYPEHMIVNVSLYDVKIYRGDFRYLEIVESYDFDDLARHFIQARSTRVYAPQYMGLIPYKTIINLKNISQKISDIVLYNGLPVIVTGLLEAKNIFLSFFGHSAGILTNFDDDFYEKSCVEILEKSKKYRPAVLDFYSSELNKRLERLVKSKHILTDMGEIIRATAEGKITQLVVPTETKIWGKINFDSLQFEVHLDKIKKKSSIDILGVMIERAMEDDVKILTLRPHFFPSGTQLMAILR